MSAAVVVTGAAGGIGSGICERLRRDGMRVVGLDLVESPAANVAVVCDVGNSEELEAIADLIDSEHDVSAVVHVAAVQPIGRAGQVAPETWLETFRVNVLAVDVLLARFYGALRRNGGSVIVIGSVHGRETTRDIAAYATTKAALEGWVRAAAIDLGPEIRVNAISPGAVETPKLEEGFARWGDSAEVRRAHLRARTPLGRLGTPGDIAGAVAFLLGEDADFITGSTLLVDGGVTARLASE